MLPYFINCSFLFFTVATHREVYCFQLLKYLKMRKYEMLFKGFIFVISISSICRKILFLVIKTKYFNTTKKVIYANIIPVYTNEETLRNIIVFISKISISRLLLSRAIIQNKKGIVIPRIEDKQFQLYQG